MTVTRIGLSVTVIGRLAPTAFSLYLTLSLSQSESYSLFSLLPFLHLSLPFLSRSLSLSLAQSLTFFIATSALSLPTWDWGG